MAASSAAVAFGALIAGAVVADYGVKSARAAFKNAASASSSGGTGAGATSSTGGATSTQSVGGFPPSTNPLPGATGSRLDQGIDATGNTFLSPWDGKVVVSNASDPGWAGGGYVAVQSTADANKVYYLAEGITPIVQVGNSVTAGQKIALPRSNPYNGIVGNIEAGLANPASPGQPLAQVVGNASQMVLDFAAWLKGLGGPTPTSTGVAGHA